MVQYGFVPDSGGAGRYRGGLSLVREYRYLADRGTLQMRADRVRFAPYGLFGGRPGGRSGNRLDPYGENVELAAKVKGRPLVRGEVVRHVLAGGGGYGWPFERDVDRGGRGRARRQGDRGGGAARVRRRARCRDARRSTKRRRRAARAAMRAGVDHRSPAALHAMSRLDGKVAIVTGGTRGIGLAIVQAYLREGARVVYSGTSEASLARARAALPADAECEGVVADLRDPANGALRPRARVRALRWRRRAGEQRRHAQPPRRMGDDARGLGTT